MAYRHTPHRPIVPIEQQFDQLNIGTPYRTPIPDTPQGGSEPTSDEWVLGPWSTSGGSPSQQAHHSPYHHPSGGEIGESHQYPAPYMNMFPETVPSQPAANSRGKRIARPGHQRAPSNGTTAPIIPGYNVPDPLAGGAYGGFHPSTPAMPMSTPFQQHHGLGGRTPHMGATRGMAPGWGATPVFPSQPLGGAGGAPPWAQGGFDDGPMPGLGYGGGMPMGMTPAHEDYPLPAGFGGAGGFGGFGMGLPQRKKLTRPKDEEAVAFNRWQKGDDFGVVLDSLQFSVLKAKLIVNPLLRPADDKPEKAASLRWSVLFPTSSASLTTESRRKSWANRDEPATFPRLSSLRICSPMFPWITEVHNPEGISCGDVLEAVFRTLHANISKPEFKAVPPASRSQVHSAYVWNRSTNPNAPGGAFLPQQMLRVDMLKSFVNWTGLVVDDDFAKAQLNLPTGGTLVLLLASRDEKLDQPEPPRQITAS